MLYIIGLGLNYDSIGKFALEIAKRCKKIYLENYTVNFPYATSDLTDIIGKKVEIADREKIEGLSLVDEARKMDVALLVYGSPLTATTHITLYKECRESGVRCKILHNASIIDAVAETGLQLYKFGKITSMPKWQPEKNYTPDSFIEILKENESIGAHSLILCDIDLNLHFAMLQLSDAAKKHNYKLKKIAVCRSLGTPEARIYYADFSEAKEWQGIKPPFCIVIPGKMNDYEKSVIEMFRAERD